MKITFDQYDALIEAINRYANNEISFYELKDLIDEVEQDKPLFDEVFSNPHDKSNMGIF